LRRNWVSTGGNPPFDPPAPPRTATRSLYGEAAATRFVETLGDTVLENARLFFDALAADGRVGSLALAERLGRPYPQAGRGMTEATRADAWVYPGHRDGPYRTKN
jgi:hypothetical protein